MKLCELFGESPPTLGLVPAAASSNSHVSPESTRTDAIFPLFDAAIPHLPSPALLGREKFLAGLRPQEHLR